MRFKYEEEVIYAIFLRVNRVFNFYFFMHNLMGTEIAITSK